MAAAAAVFGVMLLITSHWKRRVVLSRGGSGGQSDRWRPGRVERRSDLGVSRIRRTHLIGQEDTVLRCVGGKQYDAVRSCSKEHCDERGA